MAKHRRKRHRTETLHISDDLEAGALPPKSDTRSGSIKQQLDMNESGPNRGDEILHHHGIEPRTGSYPTMNDALMEENYHIDMSEDTREGDEESGDEHSSGYQADDQQELQYDTESPEDADSGAPGEMTNKVAHLDPSKTGYRRRAA